MNDIQLCPVASNQEEFDNNQPGLLPSSITMEK